MVLQNCLSLSHAQLSISIPNRREKLVYPPVAVKRRSSLLIQYLLHPKLARIREMIRMCYHSILWGEGQCRLRSGFQINKLAAPEFVLLPDEKVARARPFATCNLSYSQSESLRVEN